MPHYIRRLLVLPLLALALGAANLAHAQAREEYRVLTSAEVLDELRLTQNEFLRTRLS